MLAFHDDPKIKAKYLRRVRVHRAVLEADAGIPLVVSQLADLLHAGLDEKLSKSWPVRFSKSIPVGSDLSLVSSRFLAWLVEGKGVGTKGTLDSPVSAAADFGLRSAYMDSSLVYSSYMVFGKPMDEAEHAAAHAGNDAGEKAYKQMADKLLELIRAAPCPNARQSTRWWRLLQYL